MAKYFIMEGNMERLTKKLNRIGNKCQKYGIPFTFAETGNEEFRELEVDKDEEGKPITEFFRFVEVEVDGTAIVNDWEYMARLEPVGSKGNLIEMAFRHSETDIPEEYWTAPCRCEHCKTKRIRHDSYLVRNTKTGEWKQVGKSCLQEYTNGMDAKWIAQYISAYESIIEGEAPIDTMMNGYGRYLPVREILCYAVEIIRHFGYVKTGFSDSTNRRTEDWYLAIARNKQDFAPSTYYRDIRYKANEIGFDANRAENVQKVDAFLAWVADAEETDNYTHNLKLMASMDYISGTGILISGLTVFDKVVARKSADEKRREAYEKAKQKSSHVGSVGERLKGIYIPNENIKILAQWENAYSYYGGTVSMISLTDDKGNVFIWKTEKSLPEGDLLLTGTVKEHGEYKGLKQTILTRCKAVVA